MGIGQSPGFDRVDVITVPQVWMLVRMGTTAVAVHPNAASSAALNAESAMPRAARGASASTWARANATLSAVWSSHPR